jgi:hypothetical protein
MSALGGLMSMYGRGFHSEEAVNVVRVTEEVTDTQRELAISFKTKLL